jgi:Mg-chelatase subunit ChlD
MSTPQRLVLLVLFAAAAGCGEAQSPPKPTMTAVAGPSIVKGAHHVDLPDVASHSGTAVVILVDTSGSMAQAVPDAHGKARPKNEIARDALNGIVNFTSEWKKKHADANLQLAIFNFSSRVNEVLPMGEFDAKKAEAAVARIPAPNGGTAIGLALEDAYKALYRSGCARKFVVCVTDGENTVGTSPEVVALQLHKQTGGAVQLNFVAFDTKASQFKFLSTVNGHVVEAADGGKLQAELTTIYEKRILAEVPDEK